MIGITPTIPIVVDPIGSQTDPQSQAYPDYNINVISVVDSSLFYPCYIFPTVAIADGITDNQFVQFSIKKLIFDDGSILTTKYVYAGYTTSKYAVSSSLINDVTVPIISTAVNSLALFEFIIGVYNL